MKWTKFKDWKEETKVLLIRIWMAGAVILFIAWTPLGGGGNEDQSFIYQMLFMITLGLFLTDILIINPVARMMFNIEGMAKRFETPLIQRVIKNIAHVFFILLLVILVWLSYALLNQLLGLAGIKGGNDKPFLMLEPISFSLIYGLYFWIFHKIYSFIRAAIERKKKIKEEIKQQASEE